MLTFLLEVLVRSTSLIVAVWVLLRLCRLRNEIVEKFAWTLVAACLLVVPLQLWSTFAEATALAILPAPLTVSTAVLAHLPSVAPSLNPWLIAIYILGVLAFAGRLAAGLLLGVRLRRDSDRVPEWGCGVDVRVSPRVKRPISFGSTVLLPACSVQWDEITRRAVLAHEGEHIRNRDGYRVWLLSLCRAILWFNPLVHWLNQRVVMLSELTSDAAAVQAIGDPSKYLDLLMGIAGGTAWPEVLVPMASRLTVPARIGQLLAPRDLPVAASAPHKAMVGGLVVLLGAIVAGCAARPVILSGPAVAAALQVDNAPPSAGRKSFYPDLLRQRNIQGKAIVRITVDAHGRVVDTRIVSEAPTGVGLGEAAQRVARAYRFRNTLDRPIITTLPVKFSLPRAASGASSGEPPRE